MISICKALDISLVELLCDEDEESKTWTNDFVTDNHEIIEMVNNSSVGIKRRVINYMERILSEQQFLGNEEKGKIQRNVSIIQDIDGNQIVLINDVIFKGKRSVEWKDVEKYLRQYVGEFYQIADTKDIIYIGADLPDEYAGSNYTKHIKGAVAKAKANAVQAIPEMIEIATSKTYENNKKDKHRRQAKNGWYRYDSRFALPVYGDNGEIERYNIFSARLLIRHASSGKMYLYDVLEIKKETSKSCQA